MCSLRLIVALFALVFAVPLAAGAEELAALIETYNAAKSTAGGDEEARQKKIKENVAPAAFAIAAEGSDASLNFLIRELGRTREEIRVVCALAIVRSPHAKAHSLLLKNLGPHMPSVQAAALHALRTVLQDAGAFETELLQLSRKVRGVEARSALAPILGRLHSEDAAKALLSTVLPAKAQRRDEELAHARIVLEVLGQFDSDVMRDWLPERAFKAAGRVSERQVLVVRLCVRDGIDAARRRIRRLVLSIAPRVAAAAVEALAAFGLEAADVKQIIKMLKKRKRADVEFFVNAMDALARSDDDVSYEFLVGEARAKSPQRQLLALGSLAQMTERPDTVEVFAETIKAGDSRVRLASIRGLGLIRKLPTIDVLIEALGQETEYRLRVEMLRALVRLTGSNMGLEAADWQKWWSVNRSKFEFDAKSESRTSRTLHDLSYFGIEVASHRVVFLVDISGSMKAKMSLEKSDDDQRKKAKGKKSARRKKKGKSKKPPAPRQRRIDVAKSELEAVISGLPDEAWLNVVKFDATVVSWSKSLRAVAGGGRAEALEFVRKIEAGSGTNIYDSLSRAFDDAQVDTIYLLSDGAPSRGRITDPAEIIRAIRLRNRTRLVSIHTIRLSGGGEEAASFLKRLAEENGGEYRAIGSDAVESE